MERAKEGHTERSSILQFTLQNGYNSWNWANPKPGVRTFFMVSHMDAVVQALEPLLCCFPSISTGSWIASGADKLQTHRPMGCQPLYLFLAQCCPQYTEINRQY